MIAAEIARALGAACRSGRWWSCRCPAHDDRSPSLSVRDGDRGLVVRCWAGCDARHVLAELRRLGLLNGASCERRNGSWRTKERDDHCDRARRIEIARCVWNGAENVRGSPIERYLLSRGITIASTPSLRWMASCKHGPTETFLPAMVAKVANVDDEFIAVHRTFLLPDGSGKAAVDPQFQKMSLAPTAGGAVRLGPLDPDRALIIGEGIENTLSLMQLRGLPGWAALSTSGLKNLVLPRAAKRVLIAVDHDTHGKGEAEARDTGRRWLAEGREVRLAIPSAPGDWNDVLRGKCRV
jgi:hypothetical protein